MTQLIRLILQFQDINIVFNTENEKIEALKKCTFSIMEGETVALVGESGSGKSVMALSILGLLPQPIAQISSGSILFYDKNEIFTLSKKDAPFEKIRGEKIGMVFQEPMTSLNPLITCGEQVMESLRTHLKLSKHEALQRTIELFTDVKLPYPEKIIHRYPHEISGGQKQRVMIAIALSCNPTLIIADEPTTALDTTVQKAIILLLKELQEKYNTPMLFITHDLALIKNIADKVLVMYKGECVEQGKPAQIFNYPQHPYTKALMACRPTSTKRLHFLPTVKDILQNVELNKNEIIETDYLSRIQKIKTSSPLFSLQDVHIWYPTARSLWGTTTQWYKAVNGISLSISENETLGLVGESGCGKSTLGNALVRLTDVTKGEIHYKNKNIMQLKGDDLIDYRKEVQLIFQDPYSSLNPRITIGSAIKEPMDVHGIENAKNRKEKVIELLQKVNLLPEHYNRYPHEFSGGQRQRICIARALATQPSFIVCDESVSALDVSVQAQVLNLLVQLREEFNLAYLFISHDLQVVKHLSDHIAVMHQGKIVEYDTSENIYHTPQNNFTKQLIDATTI